MPYKIVIIDDNIPFTKMLATTIEWPLLGCAVEAVAHNGIDGKKIITELKPDIILADINMPGMDGLRMIELVKEIVPQAKIVFISAYDVFDFAARAIRLGAFDYVLKPIDKTKLIDSVKKAVRALKESNEPDQGVSEGKNVGSLGRVMALTVILNNLMLSEDEILAILKREDIMFSSFFAVSLDAEKLYEGDVLTSLLDHREISDYAITVCLYSSNRLIIYFFLYDEYEKVPEKLLDSALTHLSGSGMKIRQAIVSRIHTVPSDISTAYSGIIDFPKDDKNYRDRMNICYTDSYYEHCAENYVNLIKLVDSTCEELYARQNESARVINEFLSELTVLTHKDLLSMKFFLINFCIRYLKGHEQNEFFGFSGFVEETIVRLKKTTDLNLFHDVISKFILNIAKSDYQKESDTSIMVKNIILYIESHVAEHVTLEKLSEVFYVSPGYISTLIKKHTGKNFTYYLTRAKISLAKRILMDPRYRIEEVACAVGYKNYMSFYKVFTKYEGISPRQFRKRTQAQ